MSSWRAGRPGESKFKLDSKLAQRRFLKWVVTPCQNQLTIIPMSTKVMSFDVAAKNDAYHQIEVALTAAKSQLDSIPKNEFKSLMSAIDLYSNLKKILRARFNMTIATNATLKIYEITCQMKLFLCDDNSFTLSRTHISMNSLWRKPPPARSENRREVECPRTASKSHFVSQPQTRCRNRCGVETMQMAKVFY